MDGSNPLQVLSDACCAPQAVGSGISLHEELTTLLSQYDINASSSQRKVYAIKPTENL